MCPAVHRFKGVHPLELAIKRELIREIDVDQLEFSKPPAG